jgi:hypothetical protein
LANAAATTDEDPGYETPEDFVEPPRKAWNGDFTDNAFELKVREQLYAIKKALPLFIAHELNIPKPSTAEADRLTAYYRSAMEKLAQAKGMVIFKFEDFLRFRAEDQVRWQARPDQALDCLLNTLDINGIKPDLVVAWEKSKNSKRGKAKK